MLDVDETAVLRGIEIDADTANGDDVKWFVHDRTSRGRHAASGARGSVRRQPTGLNVPNFDKTGICQDNSSTAVYAT